MRRLYTIPVFIPYFGAEDETKYYTTKSILGDGRELDKEELRKVLNYHLRSIVKGTIYVEVFFYGRGFTTLPLKTQIEFLEVVNEFITKRRVNSIRIATRPDYIDRKTLKRLKKYKVKTIELTVQSTNEYVLTKVGRSYNYSFIKKAAKQIRFRGFNLGFHVIVGLPESNKLDELNTVKDILKLKPKIFRIYPFMIIDKTEMNDIYNQGIYDPITMMQAVERIKELAIYLSNNKIKDIHIGIEYSEFAIKNKDSIIDFVAGPYDKKFRQIVESSIWYDSIVEKIKKFNTRVKDVRLKVNNPDTEVILGTKKENARKLKDLYEVDIFIEEDKNMKKGIFKLEIIKTYDEYLEDKQI